MFKWSQNVPVVYGIRVVCCPCNKYSGRISRRGVQLGERRVPVLSWYLNVDVTVALSFRRSCPSSLSRLRGRRASHSRYAISLKHSLFLRSLGGCHVCTVGQGLLVQEMCLRLEQRGSCTRTAAATGFKLSDGERAEMRPQDHLPVTKELYDTVLDMITHMNEAVKTLPDLTEKINAAKAAGQTF